MIKMLIKEGIYKNNKSVYMREPNKDGDQNLNLEHLYH